jgi:hypothetical protein
MENKTERRFRLLDVAIVLLAVLALLGIWQRDNLKDLFEKEEIMESYVLTFEVKRVRSTTASLFDTIYFSPEMGNEFTNSQITFKVICQATQANGNAASPLDAWGWPAENSSEQSAPEQSN